MLKCLSALCLASCVSVARAVCALGIELVSKRCLLASIVSPCEIVSVSAVSTHHGLVAFCGSIVSWQTQLNLSWCQNLVAGTLGFVAAFKSSVVVVACPGCLLEPWSALVCLEAGLVGQLVIGSVELQFGARWCFCGAPRCWECLCGRWGSFYSKNWQLALASRRISGYKKKKSGGCETGLYIRSSLVGAPAEDPLQGWATFRSRPP